MKKLLCCAFVILPTIALAFDPSSPQGPTDDFQPQINTYLIQGCDVPGVLTTCSGPADDAAFPTRTWVIHSGQYTRIQIKIRGAGGVIELDPSGVSPDANFGTEPQIPHLGHIHIRIIYRGKNATDASGQNFFGNEPSAFFNGIPAADVGNRNATDLRMSNLNRSCAITSATNFGGLFFLGTVNQCGDPLIYKGWYEVLAFAVQNDHDHRLYPTPWSYPIITQSWIYVVP